MLDSQPAFAEAQLRLRGPLRRSSRFGCEGRAGRSVKAPAAKERGFDAAKKIIGRKRHVAVDADGRLLMVNLSAAAISESPGAQMILDATHKLLDQGHAKGRSITLATALDGSAFPCTRGPSASPGRPD